MTWCLEGVASEEWQLHGDGIRVVDRKKISQGQLQLPSRRGGRGWASVVWEWVGWRVQNGEEDIVFRNNGAI